MPLYVQANATFYVPPSRAAENSLWTGIAALTVPLEVSLNGQFFSPLTDYPFTYYDKWRHNMRWPTDVADAAAGGPASSSRPGSSRVFSFSPALGPTDGGTIVTVRGLPLHTQGMGFEYTCVFGELEVEAWYDTGSAAMEDVDKLHRVRDTTAPADKTDGAAYAVKERLSPAVCLALCLGLACLAC